MERKKSKRKLTPQNFTTRMLREINATKFAGSELMEFAARVHRLKPRDRVFEVQVITAIKLFKGDSDKLMSAMLRMEALARIVSEGRLEGWAKPGNKKGMSLANPVLFEAAGQVAVRIVGNRFEFSRATLLKRVFQLAKLHKD
jgi:formyltetrahydrofolate synthetase